MSTARVEIISAATRNGWTVSEGTWTAHVRIYRLVDGERTEVISIRFAENSGSVVKAQRYYTDRIGNRVEGTERPERDKRSIVLRWLSSTPRRVETTDTEPDVSPLPRATGTVPSPYDFGTVEADPEPCLHVEIVEQESGTVRCLQCGSVVPDPDRIGGDALPEPVDPSYMISVRSGERVSVSPAGRSDHLTYGVTLGDCWHGEDSITVIMDGETFPSLLPMALWDVHVVDRNGSDIPPVPVRDISDDVVTAIPEGRRVDIYASPDDNAPVARGTVYRDVFHGQPLARVTVDGIHSHGSDHGYRWYAGLLVPVTGTFEDERDVSFSKFPEDMPEPERILISVANQYRFHRDTMTVPTLPLSGGERGDMLLRRFPERNTTGEDSPRIPSTWTVVSGGVEIGWISQHGPRTDYERLPSRLTGSPFTFPWWNVESLTVPGLSPVSVTGSESLIGAANRLADYWDTYGPDSTKSVPGRTVLDSLVSPGNLWRLSDYCSLSPDEFPRNGNGSTVSCAALYRFHGDPVDYMDGDPDYEQDPAPLYVEIPNTVSGDYVGSLVNRSNREFLLSTYPDTFIVSSDRYGAESLYLCIADRIPVDVLPYLDAEGGDPLNADTYYALESSLRSEYWEDYGHAEFLSAIRDNAPDDFDTDSIDSETLSTWTAEHVLSDSDVWSEESANVVTLNSEINASALAFMAEQNIPFRISCDVCGEELEPEPGDTPGGLYCSDTCASAPGPDTYAYPTGSNIRSAVGESS